MGGKPEVAVYEPQPISMKTNVSTITFSFLFAMSLHFYETRHAVTVLTAYANTTETTEAVMRKREKMKNSLF